MVTDVLEECSDSIYSDKVHLITSETAKTIKHRKVRITNQNPKRGKNEARNEGRKEGHKHRHTNGSNLKGRGFILGEMETKKGKLHSSCPCVTVPSMLCVT
jgi:hypothetical protein